jgi:hypothetical protein
MGKLCEGSLIRYSLLQEFSIGGLWIGRERIDAVDVVGVGEPHQPVLEGPSRLAVRLSNLVCQEPCSDANPLNPNRWDPIALMSKSLSDNVFTANP